MPELVSAEFDWLGPAPVEYKFFNNTVSVFYDDDAHSYVRYDETGTVFIPSVTTAVHIIDKSAALTQWSANMACNFMRDALDVWVNVDGKRWADMTPEVFEEWLGKAKYHHKNYKEQAGETGHIAHAWIEDFIKALIRGDYAAAFELTRNLPEDARAANGCIAALDWMAKHSVRWIHTERKIYSKRHDFAGTMDGLAHVTACGDAECCGIWAGLEKVAATFVDVLAVVDWKTSNALYEEYHYQTAAYLMAFMEDTGIEVEHRFIARLGKELADFESRYLPPDEVEDDFLTFVDALNLHRRIDRRKIADREHREAVKEAKKAAKEAAEKAAKEERARIREWNKQARAESKEMYKRLRAEKVTVIDANAQCAAWLASQLIVGDEEEEAEAIAA